MHLGSKFFIILILNEELWPESRVITEQAGTEVSTSILSPSASVNTASVLQRAPAYEEKKKTNPPPFCVELSTLPESGGPRRCGPGGLCRSRAFPLLSLRHFFSRLPISLHQQLFEERSGEVCCDNAAGRGAGPRGQMTETGDHP